MLERTTLDPLLKIARRDDISFFEKVHADVWTTFRFYIIQTIYHEQVMVNVSEPIALYADGLTVVTYFAAYMSGSGVLSYIVHEFVYPPARQGTLPAGFE